MASQDLSLAPPRGKLKLAAFKFSSCDGCQLQILNLEEALLDLAEAVEIAVDTETGQIEVLSREKSFDVGRALLKKGVEHQIYGSMVMEHGMAFYWDQIFDQSNGATLNADYLQQRNPTTMDFDWSTMHTSILESNDAVSAYGVKGCGEPSVTNYVVFENAFYNATGKQIKVGPMYPARVLQALGKI